MEPSGVKGEVYLRLTLEGHVSVKAAREIDDLISFEEDSGRKGKRFEAVAVTDFIELLRRSEGK